MAYPPILAPATVQDAAFWMGAANQSVRSYCGWHVTPVVEESLVLDGNGLRTLLFPTMRLVEVLSCTNDGVDVLDQLETSTRGMLELREGRWSRRLGSIRVTLRHGFEVAEDVAGVVAGLAARAASAPAGIASQSIGPAAVRYTGESLPLLGSDKSALDPYRIGI